MVKASNSEPVKIFFPKNLQRGAVRRSWAQSGAAVVAGRGNLEETGDYSFNFACGSALSASLR